MAQLTPSWFSHSCADLAPRQNVPFTKNDPSSVALAIFAQTTLFWDSNSTVTYSFMGGSANQQARVNAAVAEWSHYTSIIFKLVGTAGQIRVAFDPDAGSWSYVGKQNLDADPTKPTMNLAWVDEVSPSPTTSDVEMGIILHEFGHALGFTHESLAPFKGGYTLDPTATTQFYAQTQGMSADVVKEEVLDAYAGDLSNFTGVSLTSNMRNFMPAELNTQHAVVPPNTTLSDWDKAYMLINYPRASASTGTPSWTFDHALDVAGVDRASKQSILESPTIDIIRMKFALWRIDQATCNGSLLQPTPAPSASITPVTNNDPLPVFHCAAEEPASLTTGSAGAGRPHTLDAPTDLWLPGAVIHYFFQQANDPVLYAPRRQALITAFQTFEFVTSINFEETSDPSTAKVFIYFAPTFSQENGPSWTRVGTAHGVHQGKDHPTGIIGTTLYLNVPLPDTPANASFLQHACFHEVGHILGLLHEHKPLNDRRRDGTDRRARDHTSFDEFSVMAYEDLDSGPQSRKPTRTTPPRMNFAPSPRDMALLRVLYPPRPDDIAGRKRLKSSMDTLHITLPRNQLEQLLADVWNPFIRWQGTGQWWRELALLLGDAGNPQPGILPSPPISVLRITDNTLAEGKDTIGGPARAVAAGPGIADEDGRIRVRLWVPGTTLRYVYQQPNNHGEFTIRRRYIDSAFSFYEKHVNIKFEEVSLADLADPDIAATVQIYIYIQPELIMDRVSWTFVGTDYLTKSRPEATRSPGGTAETTYYLNQFASDQIPYQRDDLARTTFHETGHILGLIHEHEGPRTPTEDAVDPKAGIATEFDEDSIMLYRDRPYKLTWEARLPEALRPKRKVTKYTIRPSVTDLAFLTTMYPPDPVNGQPPALLTNALKTLKIADLPSVRDGLTTFYNLAFQNGTWDEIDAWRSWIGAQLQLRYKENDRFSLFNR